MSQRLNLKLTVADTDRIERMARGAFTVPQIKDAFAGRGVTELDIERVLRERGIAIRYPRVSA